MKKFLLILTALVLLLYPGTGNAQSNVETAEPVKLSKALEMASEHNKKILVDVYAAWCPYCQRMHSEVYPSNAVQNAISNYFIWVKIDVESKEMVNYLGEEMTEAEFARALDNKNVPTVYFLNDEGSIIGAQPGYLEENVFANLLNFVGSDAYLNQSFQEYTGDE